MKKHGENYMKRCVPLEPAAEEVCNQNSIPPFIFQLPPDEGRMVLEKAQDTPVYKYPANICKTKAETTWGRIPLYFVTPQTCKPIQNVIFYIFLDYPFKLYPSNISMITLA